MKSYWAVIKKHLLDKAFKGINIYLKNKYMFKCGFKSHYSFRNFNQQILKMIV
jgi:hypothetical protein